LEGRAAVALLIMKSINRRSNGIALLYYTRTVKVTITKENKEKKRREKRERERRIPRRHRYQPVAAGADAFNSFFLPLLFFFTRRCIYFLFFKLFIHFLSFVRPKELPDV
jgi:hypothetical protein